MAWWKAHPEALDRNAVYRFVCPTCGGSFEAYGNANRNFHLSGKRECAAKRIPEDILKEKCAEALGLSEYDPAVFTIKVDSVTIPDDGVLVFKCKDGTDKTIHWENHSRREIWTDEMKQAYGRR